MKYMKEHGGALPPGGGGAGAMPARGSSSMPRAQSTYVPLGDGSLEDTMAQLRAQASELEARQAQQLAAAEQRLDRAIQERMMAQMSETRAHEEKKRAENIVSKVRAAGGALS